MLSSGSIDVASRDLRLADLYVSMGTDADPVGSRVITPTPTSPGFRQIARTGPVAHADDRL